MKHYLLFNLSFEIVKELINILAQFFLFDSNFTFLIVINVLIIYFHYSLFRINLNTLLISIII